MITPQEAQAPTQDDLDPAEPRIVVRPSPAAIRRAELRTLAAEMRRQIEREDCPTMWTAGTP